MTERREQLRVTSYDRYRTFKKIYLDFIDRCFRFKKYPQLIIHNFGEENGKEKLDQADDQNGYEQKNQ